MPRPVTIDILDQMRPNLASPVMDHARRLPGLLHCDLRIQVKEGKGAVADFNLAEIAENMGEIF